MSSRSVLKQVHFAGLSWKEEEERSRRGASQRRLRKTFKKNNRNGNRPIMSTEKKWKRDEVDQNEYDVKQKRRFQILKERKVEEEIINICENEDDAGPGLLLRAFLQVDMGIKKGTFQEMLAQFRNDPRAFSKKLTQFYFSNFTDKKIFERFFTAPMALISHPPMKIKTQMRERRTWTCWTTKHGRNLPMYPIL